MGDSEVLIKLLNSNLQFNKPSLDKILQRIQNFMKDFEKVFSFHILRELNKQADLMANKACRLPLGSFNSNGDLVLCSQYRNSSMCEKLLLKNLLSKFCNVEFLS